MTGQIPERVEKQVAFKNIPVSVSVSQSPTLKPSVYTAAASAEGGTGSAITIVS